MEKSRLHLPEGYISRGEVQYYDDTSEKDCLLVHQPEIYNFAEYLINIDHRTNLIDIGCGSGRKIRRNAFFNLIGIDHGVNLRSFKRRHLNSICIDADLEISDFELPADIESQKTIIVCADVIEHLINPINLLRILASKANEGAIVLLSTPDRHRVYGQNYCSPPANISHAQEWNLKELISMLDENNLPVSFSGYTISDNFTKKKSTCFVICDRHGRDAYTSVYNTGGTRPLAIIAAYNDEDIVLQICEHYLKNDIDLHLIDNWSDDDTYPLMRSLLKKYPERINIERFPKSGPQHEYKWVEILDRKAEIAIRYTGRWILHVDSDEIRLSPWPHLSLKEALDRVAAHGYNCVDHCVINFVPTQSYFNNGDNLYSNFRHFEFGRHPAHFLQRRTWIQPKEGVGLSNSGGHQVDFDAARVYPYRFPLLHYPIRSQEHGERKVFKDRQTRFSRKEQMERGWHNHYDNVDLNRKFVCVPELLNKYDPENFIQEYIVEVLSNAVHQRDKGSLIFD